MGAPSVVALELPIRNAIVTMDIRGDRAENGRLAGVIAVEDVVSAFQRFAGQISQSLCGSAFDGIAQQLRQTADIAGDQTSSAGVPCDAVSLGIGFTAKRIANPKRVKMVPAQQQDPCAPDGGVPDAAGD